MNENSESSGKWTHFLFRFLSPIFAFCFQGFDLNSFASFMKKVTIPIKVKQEPLDPEELQEEPEEEFVNPRQNSSIGSSSSNSNEKVNETRYNIENNRISTYNNAPAVQSRDPRLRNSSTVPNPTAAIKRQAFLSGSLRADDLIKASSRKDVELQPKQIKNIRNHTGEVHKAMNKESTSFYSNLPNVPVLPPGTQTNRSPVISNNHNAHFVSHAPPENIRQSMEFQRCLNIPRGVQETAQRFGADLDAISQRMRSPMPETSTYYSSNSRSFCTQTDQVEIGKSSTKETKTQETQTTKNTGVFSITIDLATLNSSQRKALDEFKKVEISWKYCNFDNKFLF